MGKQKLYIKAITTPHCDAFGIKRQFQDAFNDCGAERFKSWFDIPAVILTPKNRWIFQYKMKVPKENVSKLKETLEAIADFEHLEINCCDTYY